MSSHSVSTHSNDIKIVFPKSYEDEWLYANGSPRGGYLSVAYLRSSSVASLTSFQAPRVNGSQSVDKAVSLLLSRTHLDGLHNLNENMKTSLWNILMGPQGGEALQSVESLALAVKHNVFRNSHLSWDTNALLQRMRFILLKTLPNIAFSSTAQEIRSFFFDPAIGLQIRQTSMSRPGRGYLGVPTPVEHSAPYAPLKVVIIGGGPAGLSAAIRLAELVRDARRLQIHIYEKRWKKQVHGNFGFAFYPGDQRRRDQVVTLQNHVLDLLSPDTQTIMFPMEKGGPENVWPDSCNIQIQKVEDALLNRAQDSMFQGMITLHPADIKDEESLIQHTGGDFHFLVGCDGGGSWVRDHFFKDEKEDRGTSLALGVALNRHGLHGGCLPRSQPLNIFLTLSQTRYLLNASDRDGRGYLNMILTQDEFDSAVTVGGQPCTFGTPGFIHKAADGTSKPKPQQLFAPYAQGGRQSTFWQAIQDGLELFGFTIYDIDNIVRIPINLAAVSTPVKTVQIRLSGTPATAARPHCLVSLVGDAALTHHFWAGRGMNSGIKGAVAWANQVSELILGDEGKVVGLPESSLAPYTGFMERLKRREHEGRSFHILNQSGSPTEMMSKLAQAETILQAGLEEGQTQALVDQVFAFKKRFEARASGPQWYHESIKIDRQQLFRLLQPVNPLSRLCMRLTGAWPLKDMNVEAEVIPDQPKSHLEPTVTSVSGERLQGEHTNLMNQILVMQHVLRGMQDALGGMQELALVPRPRTGT